MEKQLTANIIERLLFLQQDEINSHYTYLKLANSIKDSNNSNILHKIADEELKHYNTWRGFTKKDLRPNHFKINLFFWISKIFGLTFGIKLMEKGEEKAQEVYSELIDIVPGVQEVIEDEERHEDELLNMLDEEALKYAGSVVLGLNDALVELTGALAGLTFAFQNTQLIALAGLITGISASFSMAASEYLSTLSEEGEQSPIKSAIYTGIAYIFTVMFLILPYLIFENYVLCLVLTIAVAILIIAIFNFYISVAKDYDFRKRFFQMAVISLGVAGFSFVVGNIIRNVFGIDI